MTLFRTKRLAVAALMAVMGAAAWSQDTQDKTTDGAADKAAAPAKQETAKPEAAKPEAETKETFNEITLGYGGWWISKDRRRLFQYTKPLSGFAISDLSLFTPFSQGTPYLKLFLTNWPSDDYQAGGMLILNDGQTTIEGHTQERSYSYIGLGYTPISYDHVSKITLDHAFTPNFSGFLYYQADERTQQPLAPIQPRRNSTEVKSLGLDAGNDKTQAGVVVTEKRFQDATQAQPTTSHQTVTAHVTQEVVPALSVTATGSYTKILQDGLPDSGIHVWGAAGRLELSPVTSLSLNFSNQEIDLPNVQTGIDQKRAITSVKLASKAGKWSMQGGYTHREYRHLDTDHSFIDVPKWDKYDFRISGKVSPLARLTIRGSWDDLKSSVTPQTLDNTNLLWDDNAMGQVKLEGGNDTVSAYASYTYRFRQNNERNVKLGWQNISVGGSWVASPKISLYTEVSYDTFRGGTAVPGPTGTDLSTFFPNCVNGTFGLEWVKSDADLFSGSLNTFGTNDIWGSLVTVRWRRRLATGDSFDVTWAPWRVNDRLYGQTGYAATYLSLKYTVKF